MIENKICLKKGTTMFHNILKNTLRNIFSIGIQFLHEFCWATES